MTLYIGARRSVMQLLGSSALTVYVGSQPTPVLARYLGSKPILLADDTVAGVSAREHAAGNAATLLQASIDFRHATDTTGGDAKNVQGVLTMVGWHEPPLAPGATLFDHYAAMFTGESLGNGGVLPNGQRNGFDPNGGTTEMLVQLEAALALIRREQQARGTAIPATLRGTAVAAATTDTTSIHSLTSIAGRDEGIDPHPWTGAAVALSSHRMVFDAAGDMPIGGGSDITLGDTFNKKFSRVIGRLLVSQSQFSADGSALNDASADQNCRAWLAKLCTMQNVSLRWEEFSNNYHEHYFRKANAVYTWLPSDDPLHIDMRKFIDQWMTRCAAVHVGGIVDAATMRDKQPGSVHPYTTEMGFWWPLAGQTDVANTDTGSMLGQALLRNYMGQKPWSDYTPAAEVVTTADHQGVTTLEGRLNYDAPDNDVSPFLDSKIQHRYRAFRFQHFTDTVEGRSAFCLSSIGHGAVGGSEPGTTNVKGQVAFGDPPRRSKLVVVSGSDYHRLWLAHPVPYATRGGNQVATWWENFGSDHFSSRAEWLEQHRNAVLWTVDASLWSNHATTTEVSGPCPIPDEASAGRGWYCARYGHVFVAWWFVGAHDFDGDPITYSPRGWPLSGSSVRRIRTLLDGGRTAAILATWPAMAWADFATFAATLQAITPAWDATNKVVSATLPLLRPSEPTATDDVALSLAWGALLEVDGVAQPAPGDPVVTRW